MSEQDITILRYNHGPTSTVGALFVGDQFRCYTCEDEARLTKVAGETRIPAGRYRLDLRTDDTPMNRRYAKRFGDAFHEGMLWLRDVPNFEFIYIHIGNTESDTEGCILVGFGAQSARNGGGSVQQSTSAYFSLYPEIVDMMSRGVSVWVNIVEFGSR